MRTVDPVRHEEKREEILAAAGRCFVRDGFRGATTAAICAEAGISPGHLYHYFPSKEAIIEAMAKAGLERFAERFARIAESPDIVGTLAAEIDPAKHRAKRGGQPLLLEMLAEAARNPALGKIVRDHSGGMQRLLADLLRKGQASGQVDPSLDADVAAGIFITVIDGSSALAIRDPDVNLKKSTDLLRTMIVRLLAPPGKASFPPNGLTAISR